MAQRRMVLTMPASAAAAFEAFHNHEKRLLWDTLLSVAYVEGGGTHPYVGAVTTNLGCGWKRLLGMRTRFVSYAPPSIAAAVIVAPTGPFEFWAASMRHRDLADGMSELTYTFNIRLRPQFLGRVLDPVAARIFELETRRRFAAMASYLRRQRKPDDGAC